MTTATASGPEAAGGAPPKKCSTRDLIEQLKSEVTKAQLEKEITTQKVTALEEHLQQLKDYDDKITKAADDYGKGIGALCTGFADLRAAVEKSRTHFECLVSEDERTRITHVLDELRHRRKTLKTCTWKLSCEIRDTQCALEHGKAVVAREETQLDDKIAWLDHETAELAGLKDLKDSIECGDKFSNACRYGFYRDLVARLDIKCLTADEYMCELVDQVKELDTARQQVRDIEKDLSVLQDQLTRVTQLRDDLETNWWDELCRAITNGAVSPLPTDIATACECEPADAQPAPTPKNGQSQQAQDAPAAANDESPTNPAQGEGA